jgi:hypothetical protein
MTSLFGLEAFTIAFAPRVPVWLLFLLGAAALAVLVFALVKRAHGALLRALAFVILLAMLANPLLVRETREGIANVVALIVDKTQSMDIGERTTQADKAASAMRAALKKLPGVEVRETDVHTDSGESGGTNLFAGLDQALADVPPDRVAGAIMITDGEAHDAPPAKQFAMQAPLHVLLTGAPGEKDRKLTVERAARFGIVGQQADIVVRVDDFGETRPVAANLTTRIDGKPFRVDSVVTGQEFTITVPVSHGGENVVEIEASPGADEQTLQNNRAAVVISGVRDRLKVLLVSGEPHAGERVWRNLLKADPSVDLVHFTILRPPEKQDGTPINELSLIAFPTRELFAERLDSFDLVIFDRYRRRDILPLAYFDNIARYVQNGGALLLSSGPELADYASIYRSPLAAVLPAQPTHDVIEQPFKPMITEAGKAHPVTRDLPQSSGPDGMPQWGRWFRVVGAQIVSGTTVMEGAGDHPLLVLDRVGQGRVAQLLSDQAWLWARGFEGGGPQAELLRRLAHWLMKEPDLEEEKLSAEVSGGTLNITRQTMSPQAQPVTVTTPSGKDQQTALNKDEPGVFSAHVKADELGLYHLSDGTLSAVAAAGPLNPREVADMRATDSILKPLADKTGGAVDWIRDGVPDLRLVNEGADAHGSGWIAATRRNAYRVTAVAQQPLLPPWLALVLAIGLLGLAWRREGV